MTATAVPRTGIRGAFRGRMKAVLIVALIVWGLTLFDLTLLPREPPSFLPVYPPERLVGVQVSPDTTILTSSFYTRPFGPWLLTPHGTGVRVVGANLPSEHNPKRRRDAIFTASLRTTVPDLHGAMPIDVAAWERHAPALFAISSPRSDTALDVYSLRGTPHRLLAAKLPLPAQNADRRDFALARWSGPKPDLYVIDRDAQRRESNGGLSEQPWSIRVYSGESGFQRQILHTLIRPKLSRRISKYDWWVDVGPRHGKKPDLVLVTRERRTGSKQTEIHLLSGAREYREFSLHAATALPQRLGLRRQFVFQSDSQGGAVLMLKRERGQLVVRALPLP